MPRKSKSKKRALRNASLNAAQNTIKIGESHTFCVGTSRKGIVFYAEGSKAEDFPDKIKGSKYSWLNIQVDDILKGSPMVAQTLGFTPALVTNLLKEEVSGYEDLISELGMLLPVVHISGLDVKIYQLIILIKPNMIVTIHDPNVLRLFRFSKYAVTFFRKIPKDLKIEDKISHILFRIIDENNERNFDGLRTIQEQGEIISRLVVEAKTPGEILGRDIYRMKKALVEYLDSLWASLEVVQHLRYGDAEVLSDDPNILQRFGMLGRDLTRQISISEQMSTVLASGLEVLQGIYNNQLQGLNNRMALVITWLTILGTAVMVPNTIATIFGIPNVADKFDWILILWIVGLSTVLSVIVAYFYVKRKELLPRKVD